MTGASSMRTRGYERSGVQHYRAKSRRAPGSDMPIVLRACVSARKEMRGVEALAARPARVEHALVAAAGLCFSNFYSNFWQFLANFERPVLGWLAGW